mmetsp:Transcript_18422/g.25312  ORF Transcript_18422/g.25312 Transcript_18422/m.25312 type:complete len:234 (-) Transcript_18422:1035-1736(-)
MPPTSSPVPETPEKKTKTTKSHTQPTSHQQRLLGLGGGRRRLLLRVLRARGAVVGSGHLHGLGQLLLVLLAHQLPVLRQVGKPLAHVPGHEDEEGGDTHGSEGAVGEQPRERVREGVCHQRAGGLGPPCAESVNPALALELDCARGGLVEDLLAGVVQRVAEALEQHHSTENHPKRGVKVDNGDHDQAERGEGQQGAGQPDAADDERGAQQGEGETDQVGHLAELAHEGCEGP